MTTAIIVQARWASTRLPGKAMLPLGGASVLKRVLDRCARVEGVDVVVCAIPDTPDSDPVAREAEACNAVVVRGSELDVLSRYAKAATAVGADTVMRITSDCPFIDPAICTRVLALLRETGADYVCNTMPATWAHGLDCEAFSARLLHWSDALAREMHAREHVTPWINNHPDLVKANFTGPGGEFAKLRWTLDYPEDYQFAQAIFQAMGEKAASASAAELAALCFRRADIARINTMRVDVRRLTAGRRADMETPPQPLAAAA